DPRHARRRQARRAGDADADRDDRQGLKGNPSMVFGKLTRLVAVVALWASAAWGFDHDRYQATDLDEFMGRKLPQAGVDIYPAPRMNLAATLVSYGQECDTTALKRMMATVGVTYTASITRCISVRSAGGKLVTVFIQDKVAEHLPKEVPLGSLLR